MNVELGPAIAGIVTIAGGFILNWLAQRAAAAKLAKQTKDSAAGVASLVKQDGEKKDEALGAIHTLVNSRLTKALDEIADLKKTIAGLLDGSVKPRAAEQQIEGGEQRQ